MQPIYIQQTGILSAAGDSISQNQKTLVAGKSCINTVAKSYLAEGFASSYLEKSITAFAQSTHDKVDQLKNEKHLRFYDPAVLAAVHVARQCQQGAAKSLEDCFVVCGSSRGATQSWEQNLENFYQKKRLRPFVSPQTTPGSFAAAVSQDLGCFGGQLFVSSTCTTGLQVLGTACGMLSTGTQKQALAIASERSITPFTLEQLSAIGIYSKAKLDEKVPYPYQPFATGRDGMVLGEGAAAVLLSGEKTSESMACIVGYGAASEKATATGLSADGQSLALSIQHALTAASLDAKDVDLIVGHGSGTQLGDASELAAYQHIFEDKLPRLSAHKWCWGHVLGASALMSTVMGVEHFASARVLWSALFRFAL